MPLCTDCGNAYELSAQEVQILEKVGIHIGDWFFPFPAPRQCPLCRMQRILACVNERHLCYRTCDATGKRIVSNYAPDAPFTVYEPKYWFSDAWDPLAYGRPFDFNRPFFEQFAELFAVVPRMSLDQGVHMENSAFNNYCDGLKDCYCNTNAIDSQNAYYSNDVFNCRSVLDCSLCFHSELCCELIHCTRCYNVHFAMDTEQSHDSYFLKNCRDVSDCLFCVNLRQKRFCIQNTQYAEAEYNVHKAQFLEQLNDTDGFVALQRTWRDFCAHQIVPPTSNQNCENVTGEYLVHCSNVEQSYIGVEAQNVSHCYSISTSRDCVSTYGDGMELGYYVFAGSGSYNCALTVVAWDHCHDVSYSDYCFNGVSDVFGCIALKRKQHCILNRQYTKEEYEALVPRIMEHMQKTGEWGDFFPRPLSPFPYNHSVAATYFPLDREQVTTKGWSWRDEIPQSEQGRDVSDDVQICKKTGRAFKIIPQERDFYERHALPLPILCPEERFRDRMAQMSPIEQWERSCANPKRSDTDMPCTARFLTSYAPDRPEKVYCEDCYLQEVY